MFNAQDFQFILPELILAVMALALLVGVSFFRKNYLCLVALAGIAAAAFVMPKTFYGPVNLFSGLLIHDGISEFFRWAILLVSALFILISVGYRDIDKDSEGEYYFFILVITAAMMLAVSSNNLMMIYLTLESISIISYVLVGYLKHDRLSAEAGIKYFLFGALSTGITLYGISLMYGIFGTLDLAGIGQHMHLAAGNFPILLIACIFVFTGIAFKCSLVPFHMWTPDVYQGAPTPVAGFLSVGTKAVGFAFLLRIFFICFEGIAVMWVPVALCIGVVTMTLGNCMAIGQTNMKRLLAYSTIAQAGYIMVALSVPGGEGIQAALLYIFIYVLMNLAAFGAVMSAAHCFKCESIDDFAGLFQRDRLTAICLTVALLSLAGLPPLAGFIAKFFVLGSLIKTGFLGIAVIMVINSVIAMFYYLKIVRVMFMQEPQKTSAACAAPPALALAVSLTVAANVFLGLWPQSLIAWLATITY